MAGLKKNKRQKDTSSPNLVLVLFLITFVISNIIFGLLLYFAYQEKDSALKTARDETLKTKANKEAMDLYQTALDELRVALGQELKEYEKTLLEPRRKELTKDDGMLAKSADPNRTPIKTVIKAVRDDLGYDEATGEYKLKYMDEFKKLTKEAQDAFGLFKKEQKKYTELDAQFKTLAEKQDTQYAATNAQFKKDQDAVLKLIGERTTETTVAFTKNKELEEKIGADDQARQKREKELNTRIAELKRQIKEKEEERPDAAIGRMDNRDPHALLLDISLGKPLWDDPVGVITRVDVKAREVTINLGSARGVKPDLTFNVFAPSKYIATRAEKQLKGTIEVIRVIGPNASIARITATLDPDFPMHEGDLLFNLFWGTRVAIAGNPNVTGPPTDNPSEQMRQLADFIYLLERQGIIVDAYLDLTDGQVKGTMNPSTRYLIRGEDMRIDPKELADEAPRAKRALDVTNAANTMRKEAVEKGIFIISAKNFANVIGYRQPGAARDMAAFRPSIPSAGSLVPSVGVGGPRPADMPPAEPKEKGEPKEKMDKEKM
jgi:hypothetical protein